MESTSGEKDNGYSKQHNGGRKKTLCHFPFCWHFAKKPLGAHIHTLTHARTHAHTRTQCHSRCSRVYWHLWVIASKHSYKGRPFTGAYFSNPCRDVAAFVTIVEFNYQNVKYLLRLCRRMRQNKTNPSISESPNWIFSGQKCPLP